jgi:dTDP-4-dehydrorhamnose reductase
MKILVLGCKGQLGRCLNDQLKNTDHEVIYTSRRQIDIADFEVTERKILGFSPDLVINATAYTAVDKAEEDKKTADLINHLAVANIAQICDQLSCWLFHVSTDYVFDGNSNMPYKEDDKTNPQGVYGETKLNGELAIQASGCKYIIIRTAWIFSEYGNNFLKTMLRLGAERNELSIVGDQVGCPTYAQDIARSIVEIAPQLNSREYIGIYHYCGDEPCSWYDFANAIFDQAMTYNVKIPGIVNSIKTSAYPSPAKRPAFSVLNCSKIENDFGVHASNWHDGIGQVIGRLLLENPGS